MRILLDEDVPTQVLVILRRVLLGHELEHVARLKWKSKKDRQLYRDAVNAGYGMLVTNDGSQLNDPDITVAIKQSGMHWVSYEHRCDGKKGLALAVAAIIAAMPDIVVIADAADSQRLFHAVDIAPGRRYRVIDPRREPPRYWPR